jgi:hypothetical protein
MAKVEKPARILIKRTNLHGKVPTIPPVSNPDHTELPAWKTTDIYVGEFFLNQIDQKLWIRVNNSIIRRVLFEGDVVVSNSGGTSGTSGTSGKDGTSGSSGISGGYLTGLTLSDLGDVNIYSGLTDGQILIYSGGTWYNQNNIFTEFVWKYFDVINPNNENDRSDNMFVLQKMNELNLKLVDLDAKFAKIDDLLINVATLSVTVEDIKKATAVTAEKP